MTPNYLDCSNYSHPNNPAMSADD